MPDPIVPASLAVVVLGLLASLGWGVADFGGGFTSRRGPLLGVLLGSQVASLLVGIPILLATREPSLRPTDVLIGIAGGLLGAAGLAFLYRGLAVGRMGVVAPVAAVLTATLPVGFGFLTEGLPSLAAAIGIGCAVLSVVLVSRAPSAPDRRPSGLPYAVAAGVTFAAFTVSASYLSDGLIMSPVIVIRITSVLTITAWLVVRRQPWRVPRGLWPALLAIGVLDMAATAAYLGAIAIGPLAFAAILASLYPVVTTILATVVLRERISPVHALGILAAAAAVVLIAGATA
jgi:drug/metabolite transporter (DMT)-like permease